MVATGTHTRPPSHHLFQSLEWCGWVSSNHWHAQIQGKYVLCNVSAAVSRAWSLELLFLSFDFLLRLAPSSVVGQVWDEKKSERHVWHHSHAQQHLRHRDDKHSAAQSISHGRAVRSVYTLPLVLLGLLSSVTYIRTYAVLRTCRASDIRSCPSVDHLHDAGQLSSASHGTDQGPGPGCVPRSSVDGGHYWCASRQRVCGR